MFEFDLLTFGEALVSIGFNRGEMDKYILSTVARDNKTVAFSVIKPFDRTGLHACSSIFIASFYSFICRTRGVLGCERGSSYAKVSAKTIRGITD
jgi:hypothetical protein